MINLIKYIVESLRQIPSDDFKINRTRPPGAVEEKRFMALCIRCNRCLEVCPYHSIRRTGLGKKIGTPYIFPESKGCYLCMACCRLCPTGALDRDLKNPEQVRMGKAKIDPGICYSHLFLEHDVIPGESLTKIGALCNTCYNVCPLKDTAIVLRDNLYPVVTDACVGCGVCVERCPTRPVRAVEVIPSGMGRMDEAGFYFRKAKSHFDKSRMPQFRQSDKPLSGERLLDEKFKIDSSGKQPTFEFPYDKPSSLEGWE